MTHEQCIIINLCDRSHQSSVSSSSVSQRAPLLAAIVAHWAIANILPDPLSAIIRNIPKLFAIECAERHTPGSAAGAKAGAGRAQMQRARRVKATTPQAQHSHSTLDANGTRESTLISKSLSIFR